jgi:hypothetical protein
MLRTYQACPIRDLHILVAESAPHCPVTTLDRSNGAKTLVTYFWDIVTRLDFKSKITTPVILDLQ